MENFNLNYIRKSSRKIIKNKYLTYFVALFTIFFVSESLINSDNITFIKLVFQNNLLKILIFSFICIIGYFNITLGLLLLLNFIFVINVPQRVEGFANSLPNLIDKNEILKYKKNFISPEPNKLKYKSNDEMANKIISGKKNNSKSEESKDSNIEKKPKELKESNNEKKSKKYIENPIRLAQSEKIEEIANKMKEKSNDNSESEIEEEDYQESAISRKKNKLREELEQLEKEEQEIVESDDDGTIKNDIKKKNLDKKLKLQAIKEEEDESSSESSNSSGSSSSSSDSSDSDREYNEVSINEARDHVMKKLRNKLKRKYIKGK